MARARNIKPGFFANDELAECSPMARLLFIGLWTLADREGRLEDRPKRIKGLIFPFDDCAIVDLLDELAAAGFIVRYEHSGRNYLCIPTFGKHQRPHANEQASTIPPPDKALSTKVESHCNQGDNRFALNEELGILNPSCLNEELGIAAVATCGQKKLKSPVLTEEQVQAVIERAADLRRKVPVASESEAFSLCRAAVLEICTIDRQIVDDAADATWRARAGPGYFTETLLQKCREQGDDLRENFSAIKLGRKHVREVLNAEVTFKPYR